MGEVRRRVWRGGTEVAGGELEYEGELALRLDAGGGVASAERRGLGRGVLEEAEEVTLTLTLTPTLILTLTLTLTLTLILT